MSARGILVAPMLSPTRSVAALAAVAVALAGLNACGGSAVNEVVASVEGRPITEAAVEHWLSIEAILTYQLMPTKPVPAGVVPDPPSYSACIAYLRTTPGRIGERGVQHTAAQLKAACQQRYQTLRDTALSFLITTQWIIGEGKELGLTPTEAEIRQRLAGVAKREFPAEVEYRRHLKLTGETVADQLFRSKVKLLSTKIEQRVIASQKATSELQQAQALARHTNEFARKWAARTSCRAGYIVPDCKQYKGPEQPEARI